MRHINILFWGGAKRVSMARHFKRAALSRGCEARIFSYEIIRDVPIACEGEVIMGLKFGDPALLDDLHRVCCEHDIDIIIPFIDGSVPVAAEYARRWPGTVFVPTGTPETAAQMFDKIGCAVLFENAGLPVPRTWTGGEIGFPLIAKPRHGSASQGIVTIDCNDDLRHIDNPDDYLIQERIDHRQEITVDCYVSLINGKVCAAVPRTRDAVAGGEVVRTTVIHWDEATALVERTLKALNLRGAVTVQLIHDLDTGRLFIMEINPRLGGGAVAAVHAGADLPAMILAEAAGEPAQVCSAWRNMVVARYLDEVCFELPD
ncbi:MAG: ATP-grasp domain-containing protein [Bacteroidales bacterium]|nr:ATP-grasp domain-containing protein [Bacteroidales bacterium]